VSSTAVNRHGPQPTFQLAGVNVNTGGFTVNGPGGGQGDGDVRRRLFGEHHLNGVGGARPRWRRLAPPVSVRATGGVGNLDDPRQRDGTPLPSTRNSM